MKRSWNFDDTHKTSVMKCVCVTLRMRLRSVCNCGWSQSPNTAENKRNHHDWTHCHCCLWISSNHRFISMKTQLDSAPIFCGLKFTLCTVQLKSFWNAVETSTETIKKTVLSKRPQNLNNARRWETLKLVHTWPLEAVEHTNISSLWQPGNYLSSLVRIIFFIQISDLFVNCELPVPCCLFLTIHFPLIISITKMFFRCKILYLYQQWNISVQVLSSVQQVSKHGAWWLEWDTKWKCTIINSLIIQSNHSNRQHNINVIPLEGISLVPTQKLIG